MEPLKYMYNETFFNGFNEKFSKIKSDFDYSKFKKEIFNKEWDNLELKERMRHISLTLNNHLPKDFKKASKILIDLTHLLKSADQKLGFEYTFLADYIELYGSNDYETSVVAMEEITQFTTCEFCVRPFIIEDRKKVMKQMLKWSKHKHHFVRRFSSEGCRPRLPWAMALPELKKDPSSILPILENLKNDESEFVRKSVANNLNDISKDDPALVIQIAKKWIGKSKNTDWILKHGCRTLLKQGLPEVMPIFGYGSVEKIKVENFTITTPKVKIGEYMNFEFDLLNNFPKSTLIRLEYGLYYQKANGTLAKKVFKISEKNYEGKTSTLVQRKQSFKIISTRKFHLGLHEVSVIVNGVEFERYGFELA